MQVVAFMNMKGGVGKTTLSVNVAYAIAARHKKQVLIVDADPQFNATQYLLKDNSYLKHLNDPKKGTIRDIFVPRNDGQINTTIGTSKAVNKSKMALGACTVSIHSGLGKLDLLPSTLQLIDIENSRRGTESKLKAFLKEKASHYDYVIIDCPPTISIFTKAAILASDKYLVPIKPDPLSVIGLPLLERWLDDYTSDAGIDVERVGIVYTMVRGPIPVRMQELMTELRLSRRGEVFSDHLSLSVDVSNSVEDHQPVFYLKPRSKTAGQILAITNEFIKRTGG